MTKSKKNQRERFKEMARQLKCDEDETKFNADLKKIAKVKQKSEKDTD